MKLQECIKIAKECGLTNLREAYNNIDYHSTSLFEYDMIFSELNELTDEIERMYGLKGVSDEEFFKTLGEIKI